MRTTFLKQTHVTMQTWVDFRYFNRAKQPSQFYGPWLTNKISRFNFIKESRRDNDFLVKLETFLYDVNVDNKGQAV